MADFLEKFGQKLFRRPGNPELHDEHSTCCELWLREVFQGNLTLAFGSEFLGHKLLVSRMGTTKAKAGSHF